MQKASFIRRFTNTSVAVSGIWCVSGAGIAIVQQPSLEPTFFKTTVFSHRVYDFYTGDQPLTWSPDMVATWKPATFLRKESAHLLNYLTEEILLTTYEYSRVFRQGEATSGVLKGFWWNCNVTFTSTILTSLLVSGIYQNFEEYQKRILILRMQNIVEYAECLETVRVW